MRASSEENLLCKGGSSVIRRLCESVHFGNRTPESRPGAIPASLCTTKTVRASLYVPTQ